MEICSLDNISEFVSLPHYYRCTFLSLNFSLSKKKTTTGATLNANKLGKLTVLQAFTS